MATVQIVFRQRTKTSFSGLGPDFIFCDKY